MNDAAFQKAPKVLVLGVDGGTFGVLRRMVAAGRMPFLESMIRQGVSGDLRSVIPPSTPPAWSTFATGVNSGKHGVYDFSDYDSSARTQGVVNSGAVKAETLWALLSRVGKRVGVVNVPVTYPPRPVNGVMIADFLTPEHGAGIHLSLNPLRRASAKNWASTSLPFPGGSIPAAGRRISFAISCNAPADRTKYVRHLMHARSVGLLHGRLLGDRLPATRRLERTRTRRTASARMRGSCS